MRDQIVVESFDMEAPDGRPYKVTFVKPAAATVSLISYTNAPQTVMHLTTRAYKGIYSRSIEGEYTREDAFEDIQRTKLQTPFEMIHMLWLLQDVTRAFTHQLVRYRIGTAFVQESMRFFGMRDEFKVLVTGAASEERSSEGMSSNFEWYANACISAIASYVEMIQTGVPDQDARGVLPTNILTQMFFDCSLRTLANIMPQRLCCAAQIGEWQPILKEMRLQIKNQMGESIENLLRAPYELGQECGYNASFDRPCVWRQNAKSSELLEGEGIPPR